MKHTGSPARPSGRARPSRPSGRRPLPREPLTRERIAREALALVDEGGPQALTMRALGAALGVEAMSLYHHFPSRGDVLDAVVEEVLRGIPLPGREVADPVTRMMASARLYRGAALEHPRAFVLLATRRFATPGALAFLDRLLEPLRDAGLSPSAMARWFRVIGYFIGGAGLADVASRAQQPDPTALVMEQPVDPHAYPLVARVAPHLRVERLDGIFEAGLAVLEAALRAEVEALGPGRARRRKR